MFKSEIDIYKVIVDQQRQLETTVNALGGIAEIVRELVIKVNALEENVRNEAIRRAAEGSDF